MTNNISNDTSYLDELDIPEKNPPYLTMRQRKKYNKWRKQILISIIFGYATYYLCRQNFSIIMPSFMDEYGYSKTQLGGILTIASIVYGIGKFVNGYISDKSNARYFMPLGLFCAAITTFCLGFSETLIFLGSFWVLNNWFQSMGWPPVARMLTHWFAPKELGAKWALGAASHQVGGAFTIVFSGYLVASFGWRYAFFVPSIIALIVAYILMRKLRESPKELGFPTVEAYKNDHNIVEEIEEDHLPTIEIIRKVFINKKMWYICFANMFLYVVRLGIIFWAPLFLQEFKNISLLHASWQIASYELAGLAGGFAAGIASDRIFNGKRGPVGTFFMLALALLLWIFWHIPAGSEFLSIICLVLIGFFVYGPQILVGVASADFTSKKSIGTANGLAGTMGYLGSGLSGIGVGFISDIWGWEEVFMFFITSAVLGAICFYLTWDNNKSPAN